MTTLIDRKAADARPELPAYALGYSAEEFRRLELQGAFFRDLTHDVLNRAGLRAGMHVLDVGCGVGDVALLAGEFVGPAGFEVDMGGKLYATFVAAGLADPQMIAAGRVAGGAESPLYDYMAGVVRSLLPMMERFGVATADEVGIDTLAERLRHEALANNACIMLPPLVGAWSRGSR